MHYEQDLNLLLQKKRLLSLMDVLRFTFMRTTTCYLHTSIHCRSAISQSSIYKKNKIKKYWWACFIKEIIYIYKIQGFYYQDKVLQKRHLSNVECVVHGEAYRLYNKSTFYKEARFRSYEGKLIHFFFCLWTIQWVNV